METPTYERPFASSLNTLISLFALVFTISCSPAPQKPKVFSSTSELVLPISPGARAPSLYSLDGGRILFSWTEPLGNGFAVKIATGTSGGWSEPSLVVQSNELFVNWADFPSVAAFSDGTFAAHWLIENGRSSYEYDINIALSRDAGRSWEQAIVPHRDGTKRQHGFVTLLPTGQNQITAIWLDGRAYGTEAIDKADGSAVSSMQLRTTTIDADGKLSEDKLLDIQTCSCCQTSATMTGRGDLLIVYRDRTDAEIRDISVIRMVDGAWSKPKNVHEDGWEIAGCPVNGPAIDSYGENAAVAWFTGANDTATVNLVFSTNSGESFSKPVRIGGEDVAGHVDVLQLEDGSALVSWVEYTEAGETLFVCKATKERGCENKQIIGLNETSGNINFPRMTLSNGSAYIAWTQSLETQPKALGLDTTIKMVELIF